MGKYQRNKGARIERELVNICKEYGFKAERVPLSGAASGYKNDVILTCKNFTFSVESKARKNCFKDYTWLDKCKEDALKDQIPLLIKKSDYKSHLAVMYLEDFFKLLDR